MLAAHRQMRAKAKAAARNNGQSKSAATSCTAAHLYGTCAAECSSWSTRWKRGFEPAWVRVGYAGERNRKDRRRLAGWTTGGASESYDAVIIASPAWAAGVLLAPVDPALGEELGAIPYSSSITVNLVYDESKAGHACRTDSASWFRPARAARCWPAPLSIASFWGARRPGKAVLRAFLGGMKE